MLYYSRSITKISTKTPIILKFVIIPPIMASTPTNAALTTFQSYVYVKPVREPSDLLFGGISCTTGPGFLQIESK